MAHCKDDLSKLKIIIKQIVSHCKGEGNFFEQYCHQLATRWDTGPMTNLKYPDWNELPIFNGKVPKQQSRGNIAQKVALCIINFSLFLTLIASIGRVWWCISIKYIQVVDQHTNLVSVWLMLPLHRLYISDKMMLFWKHRSRCLRLFPWALMSINN